ncbi:MAG TPA: AraC family transcriptional regulator, partial [Cyclobacteriaceae bacterium]|nr:AraC family transcriptional regulator [Cyclobacteriaceae bacterium]
DKSLAAFVESFWQLQNHSASNKDVVILPDGRIDLFFSQSATEPFHITLSGLETHPDQATIATKTIMFAVSFKLLATEYIFKNTVSNLLDNAKHLPSDFWDFSANDLQDFDLFCKKASQKIQSLLPKEIDNRKKKLFDLIYSSNGSLTVSELSEKVGWSSRQINRYFNQQFGISLKAYCSILRFRASFHHIKDGKLFPQENFADQSHFIKEVKKLAGVSPKELKRNQNDRFIQFSTLPSK